MKQVRILKDGIHEGIHYKKGEIWDFVEYYSQNKTIIIEKNNKEATVSIYNSNLYGLEAEFIEENVEVNIQLW